MSLAQSETMSSNLSIFPSSVKPEDKSTIQDFVLFLTEKNPINSQEILAKSSVTFKDYILQKDLLGWSKSANVRTATAGSSQLVFKELRIDSTSKNIEQLNKDLVAWFDTVRGFFHPNVDRPRGISGGHGPLVHIVMEHYPEGSVLGWLRRCLDAPDEVRIKVAKGILTGVVYLHEQDVILGGIHDSNVLMKAEGVPVLCDVNLEIATNRPKKYSEMVRSLPWECLIGGDDVKEGDNSRAPSAVLDGSASKAADVYSLALLICQLWTLKVPFPKIRYTSHLIVHLNKIRSSGIAIAIDQDVVPDDVWAVIKHGLYFNAATRHTAAEMLAGLEAL